MLRFYFGEIGKIHLTILKKSIKNSSVTELNPCHSAIEEFYPLKSAPIKIHTAHITAIKDAIHKNKPFSVFQIEAASFKNTAAKLHRFAFKGR